MSNKVTILQNLIFFICFFQSQDLIRNSGDLEVSKHAQAVLDAYQ